MAGNRCWSKAVHLMVARRRQRKRREQEEERTGEERERVPSLSLP
jgi:hypothetical protein